MPKGLDIGNVTRSIEYKNDIEIEHGANVIGNVVYNYGSKVVGATDIVFYNDEYPITEKVFEERWPDYMIPLDVVFENVNPELLNKPTSKEQLAKKEASNKNTAMVIGGLIGAFVFIVGGLIIVIKRR